MSFYNEQGILTLNAKQYDTGRKFIFSIIDDNEPFDITGCKVYLRMLKADGTQFQGEECCAISGNTITVDTSISNGVQILTSAGTNQCELHLTDGHGNSLTTWTFIINVEPRVHNGDHIDSIDSWDKLDKVVSDVNTLKIDFSKHSSDHTNPHEVTKTQVGLGNADNTSDMDKPVSTAQQTLQSGNRRYLCRTSL